MYCAAVPCQAVGDDRRYVCPASSVSCLTPLVILGVPTSLGENPTNTHGTASSLLGGCGSTQGIASPPLRVTGNGVGVTGVIGADGANAGHGTCLTGGGRDGCITGAQGICGGNL